MTVSKVAGSDPVVFPDKNDEIPLAARVLEATKSTFQSAQRFVDSVWKALVSWLKNSWTTSTFIFFRVMDQISPSLASKIEKGYLYCANFVSHFREKQAKESLETGIAKLREEAVQAEEVLRGVSTERDESRKAYSNLVDEHENNLLQLKHWVKENTALRNQCTHLEGQIVALGEELTCTKEKSDLNQKRIEQLEKKISLLNQELALSNDLIASLERNKKDFEKQNSSPLLGGRVLDANDTLWLTHMQNSTTLES